MNPTRRQISEDDLPGETVTSGNKSTVEEEKRPLNKPQAGSVAGDKGRAPPPIAEVEVPLTVVPKPK